MKKIFLFIALILLSFVIEAQSLKDTLEFKFPGEIIISAPRMNLPVKKIPFSTNIIDAGILQTMPRTISIDEPMKLVPGVKIDNQANGMRIHLSMRGQGILTERGIRGIKILLDGIPVNDPTGFAPDFFDVDFNNTERIEVLRGPAASLYGGSASGGIINIITKNSPDVPLFGEANFIAGSNNFWKTAGRFGGNVDKVNYNFSFSRTMGDGYRVHTHFWGNNVYGKLTYSPNTSIQLTPIFGWTNVYHENPEGINLDYYNRDPKLPNDDAVPFNEYLQTNRFTNALKGLFLLKDNQQISFNGYIKRTLFTEANNHTFNHRTITTPGASIQYTIDFGKREDFIKNKISVGSDIQWQKIEEYRVDNIYSLEGDTVRSKETIKQSGVGIFLIDNLEISNQWSVMVSLRYDKITNKLEDILKDPYDLSGNADFSKATGRVGVTYSPIPELNIFANWGQGFLPPATEELAQNPDQFGGFNTHLTYSTSNGIDVGARGNLMPNLYYDVTGFYLKTKDDFDRYRITNPLRNQETFYRNIGSSDRIGLEIYGKYTPVAKLQLQLAYTYSHFKYTNPDPIQIVMDDPAIIKFIENGKLLPNSPEHQIYFDVQYNPISTLVLGISTETLSKAYIDGANIDAEAVEAYTLINIRAGYDINLGPVQGEISFQVKNLTDKKYVAFSEPDPGGNAYQPGAGREFFGGFKIKL